MAHFKNIKGGIGSKVYEKLNKHWKQQNFQKINANSKKSWANLKQLVDGCTWIWNFFTRFSLLYLNSKFRYITVIFKS